MNKHLRGYKIKMYPTKDQELQIKESIDVYRAVFNTALDIQRNNRKNGNKYISFYQMEHIFSEMYNNDPNYSWMRKIPMSNIREALADLDMAYKSFFRGKSRFPKYKSKKEYRKMLGCRSDRCRCIGNSIYISGVGYIDCKNHNIPIGIRMYDTRITFDGYNYWYSCIAEKEMVDMTSIPKTDTVGIDVGIRNFATTSNGEVYQLSDISKLQKRLKRQQKRMSRYYNRYLAESKRTTTKYEDIPKSKNMLKALKKQRKIYDKIKNKRYTDIHTITKQIVNKNPECIVIEDIRTRELLNDRWFLKRNPYPYFFEFRRQICYKAEDRGISVIIADTGFASSQICSNCGSKHKIYSNKLFICPICGLRIDRDLNAAYNLRNYGINSTLNMDIAI